MDVTPTEPESTANETIDLAGEEDEEIVDLTREDTPSSRTSRWGQNVHDMNKCYFQK